MDPGWIYSSNHLHLYTQSFTTWTGLCTIKRSKRIKAPIPPPSLSDAFRSPDRTQLSPSLPVCFLTHCLPVSQTCGQRCSTSIAQAHYFSAIPLTCSKCPTQDGMIKVADLNGQTWDQSPPRDSRRSKWVELGLKSQKRTQGKGSFEWDG